MTATPKICPDQVRRVLVRATNWVGDVVMMLPALEALRREFAAARITVLARPWVAPLLACHPAVDELLLYEGGKTRRARLAALGRVVRGIRAGRFDLAVLFQNAFEAALLAFLGGVPLRVGYAADGRQLLLTHAVRRTAGVFRVHQVEYYLELLRAMGWRASSAEPEVFVCPADQGQAAQRLRDAGLEAGTLLVGLGPGAVYGGAKRWPAKRFAALGDLLAERWNAKLMIFGSPGERAIGQAVTGYMRHEALDLVGQTGLGEAMALLKACRFFVTNDSGLMHVAAAQGVPTLAVFGSTDPVATGPRGRYARIVRRPVDCAPCLQIDCPTDHRCMQGIAVADVWQALEALREEVAC